jgi:hypothetical protein
MTTTTRHLLILTASASLLCGCNSPRTTISTAAWEYKIITFPVGSFASEINAYGTNGWNVVGSGPEAADTMFAVLRREKR